MDAYQLKAFDKAILGSSFLLTGGAGSGKSFVVNNIIEQFASSAIVCAPTWNAATLINGVSIHNAFKILPNRLSEIEYDGERISLQWANKHIKCLNLAGKVEMVIIDEISMVSGDMLMWIDMALRKTYKYGKPFGGVQMIFVGDFSQLPPITCVKYRHVFDCPVWKEFITPNDVVHLRLIHRQEEVPFLSALERVRQGLGYEFFNSRIISPEAADKLLEEDPSIVRLSPKRQMCISINDKHLASLPGEAKTIQAVDILKKGTVVIPTETAGYNAPPVMALKVGAKIILTRSLEPKRKNHNGKVFYIKQIAPLYAETLEETLSKDSKNELHIYARDKNNLIFNTLSRKTTDVKLLFAVAVSSTPDGEVELVIHPHAEIQSSYGHIVSMRIQLPIVVGYAITIHRSQGMTFTAEILYLDGSFSSGMIYVALSRCKTLSKLYIVGTLPDSNDMDLEVLRYLRKINVILE